MDNIKTIFVSLYGDQLKKPNTSVVACPFDEYFDQQIRELEGAGSSGGSRGVSTVSASDAIASTTDRNLDVPPPLPEIMKGTFFSTR